MTICFGIDYFRITVHLPLKKCIEFYNEFFMIALGELTDLQHGAKGFKGVMGALQGFQLKHTPVNQSSDYCTFEFPGQACGSVAPEQLLDFYHFLDMEGYRKNVTRLDLAFDNVPFTPSDIYQTIIEDVERPKDEKHVVRSSTERQSVQWVSDPYQIREDLSGVGCDTCYFGKRSSMRFLRVYNKHGPTRLEIELKQDRANLVAHDLLLTRVDNWHNLALGHLLDFIDIDRPWWKEFIGNNDRAYKKLHYAKDVVLEKQVEYLNRSHAAQLAAITECTGGEILHQMITEGRKKMYKRYGPLLSAHKLLPKRQSEHGS